MTRKRLETFEEKVNAFMRMRESSTVYIERDYVQRFGYMPPAQVHELFVLCGEIERTAEQLAIQVQRGIFDPKAFSRQLREKYPYLEEKRVARLVSRSLYRTFGEGT